MSHPDRLPDLFVDRSLGRIEVPRLLRDHGLRLTTLAERYGIPADERVSDVRWLKDSGERGEAVLMKDGSHTLQRSREDRGHAIRSSMLLSIASGLAGS